jgi:carboxyl-terminal processing protease
MFKKYRWLWVVLPTSLLFLSFCLGKTKKGEDQLPKVVLQTLASTHYNPTAIDDSFSQKVFHLFLKRLDRSKRFFLQEDYDKFKVYEFELDNQANEGTYAFFDMVSTTFLQRVEQMEAVYEEVLSQAFDFTLQESYTYDEDNRDYLSGMEELKADWYKYLKLSTLEKYYSKVKANEKNKESSVSNDSLEHLSRQEVLKSQRNWFKRLKKFDRDKQLDYYINCMTEVFDPHTGYFPPKDKEDFDIRMSGRLEGIGAQLSERDGEIKVEMIVPGSPSYLQGELKEGDIVIKVAQKDSVPVDVRNMDLSDAVQLIRGKKGSTVVLTVRKPDGTVKEVAIVRDVVIMEEGYAKSAIIKEGKNKVGFIHLPQFYTDMSGNGGRTCAQDVKVELQKLIKEGVDGVVLDLRNNGGGSLQDVVDMAGLFIGGKPVVQAKYRDRKPDVLVSRETKILYDGPLVILVNKYSASASEILAAALQDYERALIMGTNDQTFGKGTVQRFIDLDRYGSSKQQFGALKVTIQKFYRVNGGTTQLYGVTPDVVMPERFASVKVGESTEEFPLKWNEIEAVPIKLSMPSQLNKIKNAQALSKQRISQNRAFTLLIEESKRIEANRNKNVFTLHFDTYAKENETWEKQSKAFDEALKANIETLKIQALKRDLKAIGKDKVRLKIKTDWLKNYQKDIYLKEAVQAIRDLE